MRHSDVWRGLDQLAALNGLTPSGLAKKAGLDSTAFNPSKRTTKDGRLRWPSTESLSRALGAVGARLDDFVALVDDAPPGIAAPLLRMAEAAQMDAFDERGFPKGAGWDEIRIPSPIDSDGLYALEISGDQLLPTYRDGDRIIVSAKAATRRGDRIVAKTKDGRVIAKELRRETNAHIELASLAPSGDLCTYARDEIAWIARILWVSQ
ncbi:MAG: helix-turn-helix transcriptional regulator [Pseudomonadota bacterium]